MASESSEPWERIFEQQWGRICEMVQHPAVRAVKSSIVNYTNSNGEPAKAGFSYREQCRLSGLMCTGKTYSRDESCGGTMFFNWGNENTDNVTMCGDVSQGFYNGGGCCRVLDCDLDNMCRVLEAIIAADSGVAAAK